MSDLSERLRRLLLLVPLAARRPGITVQELAQRLGVDRSELLEDLDLLTMVGRPPFSPDDFIDIYTEGENVRVALDQRFSRPPRLTAPEAAVLLASAQVLKPAARSALGSAQQKLLEAMPSRARQSFGGIASRVGADAAPMDDLLEPLAQAAREMREVELVYLAAGRTAGERRTVRPYAVYLHRGHWYLAGYCAMRQGERLFRVDRIGALELTERKFEHRRDVEPQVGGGLGERALVRFSREAAPFVRERFPDAAPAPGGGLEVTLAGAAPEWIVPYILSFGGEAEVVQPAGLRAAVREAARRALDLSPRRETIMSPDELPALARLPMSFPTAERLLEERARSAARAEVTLQGPAALAPGTRVVVVASAPALLSPLELVAEVVGPAELSANEFVMKARYLGHLVESSAFDSTVRQALEAQAWERVRRSPRVPLNLIAEDAKASSRGYFVRDISEGGIGIIVPGALRCPARPGARFMLEVELEPMIVLELEATLVWAADASAALPEARFGARFEELSEGQQVLIHNLLRHQHPVRIAARLVG